MVNTGYLFYKQLEIDKSELKFNIAVLYSIIKKGHLDGAYSASKGNMCITKYFEFLKKTQLDEIFQFYDVFVGDMSLIGSRSESLSCYYSSKANTSLELKPILMVFPKTGSLVTTVKCSPLSNLRSN